MTDTQVSEILVATDFSDTARTGARWAIEIARHAKARVRLLHVLILPHPWPHYAPAPPELDESLREGASDRLAEEAEELGADGADVVTELRTGIPSQVILEAAEDTEADLVVMGTRGLSGLSHLLLGSTAERVVQKATCPVLTVHPEDRETPDPLRSILVPTDFSDDAERAINTARRLLHGVPQARLVLVHAYALPIEYTAYGPIPTSVNYLENTGAKAQAQLEELAERLEEDSLNVEALAVEGYPPQVILDTARTRNVDLIAMGTHGRTGIAHLLLGSTAERVVQKASCPVITVRTPDED